MARRKAGAPIIPANKKNPVGQVGRIKHANAVIGQWMRKVQNRLVQRVRSIDTQVIAVNTLAGGIDDLMQINKRYEYQISLEQLSSIVNQTSYNLESMMPPEISEEVTGAYEEGTGQSVRNLSTMTDDYTRTITQVLTSDPYRRRVALVRSRLFEDMKGFQGQTGADLARILGDAVDTGQNPRDLIKTIAQRFDVAKHRAERIARTEITGALRRARFDEAQDAELRLDIPVRMLHLSALSPTTRESHARLHGELRTVQACREWYSVDGNSVNCKCVEIETLVNKKGEPLTPGVIAAVKAQKQ